MIAWFFATINSFSISFIWLAAILGIFLLLVIIQVCFSVKKAKKKKYLVIVLKSLLGSYILFVFVFLVLDRTVQASRSAVFSPFWSYKEVLNGNFAIFWEVLFNIVLFIPVGFLIREIWTMTFFRVFFVGVLLSVVLEITQLLTKRGLFELDDIIHNSIGCLIGYLLCISFMYWHNTHNVDKHGGD